MPAVFGGRVASGPDDDGVSCQICDRDTDDPHLTAATASVGVVSVSTAANTDDADFENVVGWGP